MVDNGVGLIRSLVYEPQIWLFECDLTILQEPKPCSRITLHLKLWSSGYFLWGVSFWPFSVVDLPLQKCTRWKIEWKLSVPCLSASVLNPNGVNPHTRHKHSCSSAPLTQSHSVDVFWCRPVFVSKLLRQKPAAPVHHREGGGGGGTSIRQWLTRRHTQ